MARLLRSYGVSKLRPPAVVGASITFSPVKVTLTHPDLRRRQAKSKLAVPPAFVVSTLPGPVSVRLARARVQKKASFRLSPPAVTGASITFRPIQTRLVQRPATAAKAKSRLSPPATLAVVVAAILAPITTRLARRKPSPLAASKLRPPSAVGDSITFRPLQVRLVRPRLEPRKPKSILRPPATLAQVLAEPFAPIIVRLTRAKRKVQAQSELRAPTVVAPSITFRPLRIKLVQRPKQAGKSQRIGWRKVPGLSEAIVFITGFFDQPSLDGSVDHVFLHHDEFGPGSPGGDIDHGTPGGTFFDDPDPRKG